MESIKKYVAEFIGTFVLVLLGCGTAMLVGCDSANGGGYILTALAFGLVIVGMAYCIGNISGWHINPAVSLGVLISGGMSITDFIGYIVAQVLGAIAGTGALKAIFDLGNVTDMTGGYGSTVLPLLRRSYPWSYSYSGTYLRNRPYRYFCKSCQKHWSCYFCRRRRTQQSLGIHRWSSRWCCSRSYSLQGSQAFKTVIKKYKGTISIDRPFLRF